MQSCILKNAYYTPQLLVFPLCQAHLFLAKKYIFFIVGGLVDMFGGDQWWGLELGYFYKRVELEWISSVANGTTPSRFLKSWYNNFLSQALCFKSSLLYK